MNHTLFALSWILYGVFIYFIPWMLEVKKKERKPGLQIKYTVNRELRNEYPTTSGASSTK